MKIAIVDDERPSRSELCYLVEKILPSAELFQACSGSDTIELAALHNFSIFFLDIHLGDIEGTTLATMLAKIQPQASIIFSTAYSEHAVKAFDLGATDYILKPYSEERVKIALEKATATLPQAVQVSGRISKLPVYFEKKFLLLDLTDILYIEKSNRTCTIYCLQGSYPTSSTLENIEKQLSKASFLRVHKSTIVNLEYISEIAPWFNNTYALRLSIPEMEPITVGRTYIRSLREALGF